MTKKQLISFIFHLIFSSPSFIKGNSLLALLLLDLIYLIGSPLLGIFGWVCFFLVLA